MCIMQNVLSYAYIILNYTNTFLEVFNMCCSFTQKTPQTIILSISRSEPTNHLFIHHCMSKTMERTSYVPVRSLNLPQKTRINKKGEQKRKSLRPQECSLIGMTHWQIKIMSYINYDSRRSPNVVMCNFPSSCFTA